MPEIQAFRGLRYNLARVGSISGCIAPPYDVIDADLQQHLYSRSPYNFVRLELNRPEPSDQGENAVYDRAARLYRQWRNEGVLQPEPDPAIYVYHQEFEIDGLPFLRRGFLARVKLERFGEGKVFPHEETLPKAKADRLKLLEATEAQLSPIFGLYLDPECEVQQYLENYIAGVQGLVAKDDLGVIHRVWPISDVHVIQHVTALIDDREMFVADGHHRYETACDYRDELRAQPDFLNHHAANYVFTMLVSMDDPGLTVLPTHRLFHGIPSWTTEELVEKLSPFFDCEQVADGPESAGAVWAELVRLDEQLIMALYSPASKQWIRISAKQEAADRMASIASEKSPEWQGLGVAMLHRLVIEDLLGLHEMPKPVYVHQVQEVIDGLEGKLASGKEFGLAALVMPATLEHIQQISLNEERMPAKSTYFFPKLASGLVIHPLT